MTEACLVAARKHLEGDAYAPRVGRALLVLLIDRLLATGKNTKPIISYRAVVDTLGPSVVGGMGKTAAINVRHALDRVGKAVKDLGAGVEPITVIVVGSKTGVASPGVAPFLGMTAEHFKELSFENQQILLLEAVKRVSEYPYWAMVKKALLEGSDIWPPDPTVLANAPQRYSGPEGDEHKAIKKLILAQPHLFGLPSWAVNGREEGWLLSGDRVDVLFEANEGAIAIEIKPSSAPTADQTRGLFQANKYYSTLVMQRKWLGQNVYVRVLLVLGGSLDDRLRPLFHKTGVTLFERVRPDGDEAFKETPRQ